MELTWIRSSVLNFLIYNMTHYNWWNRVSQLFGCPSLGWPFALVSRQLNVHDPEVQKTTGHSHLYVAWSQKDHRASVSAPGLRDVTSNDNLKITRIGVDHILVILAVIHMKGQYIFSKYNSADQKHGCNKTSLESHCWIALRADVRHPLLHLRRGADANQAAPRSPRILTFAAGGTKRFGTIWRWMDGSVITSD